MAEWLSGLAASGNDGLGLLPPAISLAGGMLAGFSPCVLPILPAVFAYLTKSLHESGAEGVPPSGRRPFSMAAVFVLGMALVFTVLGAAAGALGSAIVPGAWAYYLVAAVCVLMGLQMLEVVDLRLDRIGGFTPKRPKGGGLVGALLFGMGFGLVASPCSTPILAVVAAIAAAEGSAAKGAGLLFLFGLGKGAPVLLMGAFSSVLPRLRSFAQVTAVLNKVGGAALIGLAAYLVWVA